MIFHLGFELPQKEDRRLDHESCRLTPEETRILKRQIRRNSITINEMVARLDLLVNKEKYPHREDFINKLRDRLEVLMDENDTFRRVLQHHYR
ncbi:MAG: hypothetical protein H6757_02100 [Candidatus Omnitrophica bacterium]|nr:hypothetical protein [Candidatus Omnitrophota bacterium]